jgi:hypothetical protein
MRTRALVFIFVATCGAAVTPLAWAANAVVGTGSPGSCNEAALASAVNALNAGGGTMTFNCGGPATIAVTSQKVLIGGNNLVYTIDGGGKVTLSGGGTTSILLQYSGTLNIRNITFASGLQQNGGASGGAIRSDALQPPIYLNLANVTFTGNATNLTEAPAPPFSPFDFGGGALFTRWGIVTISGCTFTGNAAYNTAGGALHVRSSTVSIVDSTFTSNLSNGGGFGGAIWVDGLSPGPSATGGTLQITRSGFTSNVARNQGGAVGTFLHDGKNESITLNAVRMIGNQVVDSSGTFLLTRGFGGGLSADHGRVTILNSTFANNVVRSNAGGGSGGGASLTSNDAAVIENSTFTNNRAEGTNSEAVGGGLLVFGNAQPFSITHATIAFNFAGWTGGGIVSATSGTLRNTIVANNDAAAFPSPFQDQCASTLTNGGGVMEFPANNPACASGATVANPMLVTPMAANGGYTPTHLLQPGSPAIDAGGCVLPNDQRGIPRPQGPACDLGAVEMTVPSPSTQFFTIPPCRRVDTRSGGGGPLACGVTHTFSLTGGACGVPSGAEAVAVNVTITEPSAPGNVNVFPGGTSPPITAILNYSAGATRGNNAVVQLGAGGQVGVRCSPSGSAHVIIDVNGYFQ